MEDVIFSIATHLKTVPNIPTTILVTNLKPAVLGASPSYGQSLRHQVGALEALGTPSPHAETSPGRCRAETPTGHGVIGVHQLMAGDPTTLIPRPSKASIPTHCGSP